MRCGVAGTHLFLADEGQAHGAGGVVPAADCDALQHLRFHDVTAVLVDVVVGLPDLPKTKGGK